MRRLKGFNCHFPNYDASLQEILSILPARAAPPPQKKLTKYKVYVNLHKTRENFLQMKYL
jgi:hypothetical protein